VIKIAITGPESSGKTTIAKYLSKYFKGEYVQEYSREYLNHFNYNYKPTIDDLIEIANNQFLKNISLNCQKKYLICDTDMTVIKIWATDKFGYCPKPIEILLKNQKFDIIFLCKPDMPWIYDPLRVDENRREILFDFYQEELQKSKSNFYILEGCKSIRNINAIKIIKSFDLTQIS